MAEVIVSELIRVVGDSFKRRVTRVVRVQILNIKDEEVTTSSDHLRNGNDELRRAGRMIPMSSQLVNKVKKIYKKCQTEDINYKPLIEASRLGLADIVWCFIECAKQTNTNLHTRETSPEPLTFLLLQNKRKETALDVAIDTNNVEVAKLLLNNASEYQLKKEWIWRGKSLLPLLCDPKHDLFIFNMLTSQPTSSTPTLNAYTHSEIQDRRKYLEKLDDGLLEMNPSKNTILHVVSKSGDMLHVNDILEKDPSLIYCHNLEGETPAYVSAREGHFDILELMINSSKGKDNDIESLVTRSKDKHNALHIAIQNHHAAVVFLLVEKIPQLANHINDFNESPLYLAAERGYISILELILNKCNEKAFEGPNGKTALHAAAISNSAGCIKYLLKEKPSLVNEKDENGWTPLRYAVYYNNSSATKELLTENNSIGYELMTQGDILSSAIHIAASRGHCETIKVLMKICPGSSEFIDNKGRNILHVAVESKKNEVIEFIFRDESLTSLINQKDSSGNTPVHLLVGSNFEMMEMVIDSRVDINVLNNEKLTPLDMTSSDEKRERVIKGIGMHTNLHNKTSSSSPNISKSDLYEKETEATERKSEKHFKIVDNLVLVSTLIVTATFAAAFTVPGGFDSDNDSKQGTPFLLKKSAFQAFVVTNAIAFSCSCSVLLGHIVLLIYRSSYDEAEETEQKYIDHRIVVMYFLTGIALLAMLIAFVTGLYVVLTPSLGLAISVCVMSLCILMFSLKA